MDDRPVPPDQGPPAHPPTAPPPIPGTATEWGAPPTRPPGPSAASLLTEGWSKAIRWAAITVIVLAVLAELMAFLGYATAEGPKPSLPLTARAGGAVFYWFHHVGLTFRVPNFNLPTGAEAELQSPQNVPSVSLGFTLALALLTGTLLGAWLLYRGGRSVAEAAGGPGWARGLHGAKLGIPYALICFALAFAVSFTIPLPANPTVRGAVSVHPSYLGALLWPLAIGLVMGFVGGFRTAGPAALEGARLEVNRWRGTLRGAVSGGVRMVVYGLVLAVVGLIILAPLNREASSVYFFGLFGFDEGALPGLAQLLANVLVLATEAALVLFPSMGVCLGASGAGFSFCFLSYTRFPSGAEGTAAGGPFAFPQLPSPPAPYFLFVLVPLLAVVLGGMAAARRSDVATRGEATAAGVLAGVVFGLLSLVLAILAGVSVKVSGAVLGLGQTVVFRLGPDMLASVLLGLAWGVAGGAVGGFIQGRGATPRPAETAPAGPSAGLDQGWGTASR